MKNKGFTLIELLAVIVILAIIALIAVPIILNIINSSSDEANERSVDIFGRSIKNSVLLYQVNSGEDIVGSFKSVDEKTITNGEITLKVEYEGNVECDTIEIYADDSVYLSNCRVSKTPVEYTYGNLGPKIYANGEIVYFDVLKGAKCTKEEYEKSYETVMSKEYNQEEMGYVDVEVTGYLNSLAGYNGVTKVNDVQNSCLKFYTFNDDGNNKVNLLLDHNTSNEISWNSTDSNAIGPTTLLEQLQSDTSAWVGTEIPTNYSLDQSNSTSGAQYTIDYSAYKARLITTEEIAKITGNTSWDLTNEESTPLSLNSYGWLYDRTSPNCKDYGCSNNSGINVRGYWTASSTAADSLRAWGIESSGSLKTYFMNKYIIDTAHVYGVRPVIEVLKSKLS